MPRAPIGDFREFWAVRDANFTINKGEMVALMGASGSGKTTLMNILGCLDRPSAGEYWLDGEELSDLTPDQRALVRTDKLGFVYALLRSRRGFAKPRHALVRPHQLLVAIAELARGFRDALAERAMQIVELRQHRVESVRDVAHLVVVVRHVRPRTQVAADRKAWKLAASPSRVTKLSPWICGVAFSRPCGAIVGAQADRPAAAAGTRRPAARATKAAREVIGSFGT